MPPGSSAAEAMICPTWPFSEAAEYVQVSHGSETQGQIQVLLFRGGKWLEKMGGHQSLWAELARKGAS